MNAKRDQATRKQDESGLEVAVSVGAAVLGCFVPGAGQSLELAQKITAYFKAQAGAKEQQRLEDYCRALLQGAQSAGDDDSATTEAAEADFEAILSALLDDQEEEKATHYAQLTQKLATGKLAKPYIKPTILALKDIGIHEINALRTSYIAQRHALIPVHGPSFSADLLPPRPDNPDHFGYQQMEQRGLIHARKLTQFGARFIEAVCPSNLLTPESIGLATWLTTCMFVSYEMHDDHLTNKLVKIADRLREARVNVISFCALTRKNEVIFGPPHAFVFFGPSWKNSIEYRPYLNSNLRNIRTIVVLLPGADDESLEDLQPAEVIRGHSLDNISALTDEIAQALIRGAPQRPTSEGTPG